MSSIVSCQEALKHVESVYGLENGIDDWCTFQGIETYFGDEISTSRKTVTDGSGAGKTGIMMSHGIWIFSWSGSCNICCENGFSRSGVTLGDYCFCCGGGCGYDKTQSPNDPESWNGPIKGWMCWERQETGLHLSWLAAGIAEEKNQ